MSSPPGHWLRRIRRKITIVLLILLLLAAASLVSVRSYGQFARHARGLPGYAIAADRVETKLDHAIAPMTDAHPGQSGILLLDSNLDAFAIRAVTAREAGRSLDVQYYIWHDDLTGRLLARELFHAAGRGVRVRILLDDLNAHGHKTMLAALNHHPMIEVRMFNPARGDEKSFRRGLEMLLRFFSTNRRMHNKAWIADNRIAIVGGRNIGDEYFDAAHVTNFVDTDVVTAGPTVAQASTIFDDYWNSAVVIPLEALTNASDADMQRAIDAAEARATTAAALPYISHLRQNSRVQALLRGDHPVYWTDQATLHADPPEKVLQETADAASTWLLPQILPALRQARQEVLLTSPYFVPGDPGAAALQELRNRDVAVSVLTNSLAATDVLVVHGGYAKHRTALLDAGIEIHELMPFAGQPQRSNLLGSSNASLHTKSFLVDGETGFVGSFNLDPRSVMLNTEMGLLFRQPQAVAALKQIYQETTATDASYRVYLDDGRLRWEDGTTSPATVWTHEPQTALLRRAITRIVSWLPLESQL